MKFSEKKLVTLGEDYNNMLLIDYRVNLEHYLGEILPKPHIDKQPNNKSIYSFPDGADEDKESLKNNESIALKDKLTSSIENIKKQAPGANRDEILNLLTTFDANWLKPKNITFKGDQVKLKCWGIETRYLTYLQEEVPGTPLPKPILKPPKPTNTPQKPTTGLTKKRSHGFIFFTGLVIIGLSIGAYIIHKQDGILPRYNLKVVVKDETSLKNIRGSIVSLSNLDSKNQDLYIEKRLTQFDGTANFTNLEKGRYKVLVKQWGYPHTQKIILLDHDEHVPFFIDYKAGSVHDQVKTTDNPISSSRTSKKEKWWQKIWGKIFKKK